jgi:RNA polymerase sigma-70 factor (ECF subfamily)
VRQAERRLAAAPASTASPEELFDRHWAVAVLDAALAWLEAEMRESGRGAAFEQLLPSWEGDDDRPRYAEIARRLDTTEEPIKVTVYRLRRRYRDLIRLVVGQTVNNPMEVETELAHLMAALRG